MLVCVWCLTGRKVSHRRFLFSASRKVCVAGVCVCVCVSDDCVYELKLCVCTGACNERHRQPGSPCLLPQCPSLPHCILCMTTPICNNHPTHTHHTHTHTHITSHTHRWSLCPVLASDHDHIWRQSHSGRSAPVPLLTSPLAEFEPTAV